MLVKCKLIDQCMDCKRAHIDVYNEIVRPSGSIIPETVKCTIYCKHMDVCSTYLQAEEGDHLVMVPLSHFIGGVEGSGEAYPGEFDYEGDGINE